MVTGKLAKWFFVGHRDMAVCYFILEGGLEEMKAGNILGREEDVQTLHGCMAGLLWEGVDKGVAGVKGKEEKSGQATEPGCACWSSEPW